MNPPLFLLFPPLLSPSPSVPAGRAMCVMPRGERKTYPESLKNWIAIGNKLNHPAEHLGAVKHPFWRPPSQLSDLWLYSCMVLAIAKSDKQMRNVTCLSSASLPALKLFIFTGELFALCVSILLQQPKSLVSNRRRNTTQRLLLYVLRVQVSVSVPLCGFHCTVCMLLCVGGQKMWQINLWGCASGAPSTACMSIHMGSPMRSCLSFEWLWVNAIFCFVWECLKFDQSHKSIQSHLCMLTL